MSKYLSQILVALALCGLAACGDSAASDDGGGGNSNCGNGTLDMGEQCDTGIPPAMWTETCSSATVGQMPGGVLGCNPTCTFNTTMCTTGPATGGVGGMSGTGGTGGAGGMGGVGGSSGAGGVGGS